MIASFLIAVTALGLTVLFTRTLRRDGAKMRAALQGRSLKAAGHDSPVAVKVSWLPRAEQAPAPLAANLNRRWATSGWRAAA